MLCFGWVAEKTGRAVAEEMDRRGNVVTKVILPTVGVVVLVDDVRLSAGVIVEYLVTEQEV